MTSTQGIRSIKAQKRSCVQRRLYRTSSRRRVSVCRILLSFFARALLNSHSSRGVRVHAVRHVWTMSVNSCEQQCFPETYASAVFLIRSPLFFVSLRFRSFSSLSLNSSFFFSFFIRFWIGFNLRCWRSTRNGDGRREPRSGLPRLSVRYEFVKVAEWRWGRMDRKIIALVVRATRQ